MTQTIKSLFLAVFILLLWNCPSDKKSQNSINGRKNTVESNISQKNTVTTEVNQLRVNFGLSNNKIESAEEFEVRAIFTNKSESDLRLNALFLDFSHILLEVRHIDETRVNPGSPPFPPEDDGKIGRLNLKPDQSVTFTYKGSDYFSQLLPKGKYKVRFRYENKVAKYGDWTGAIETDWLNFEIVEKSNS